VVIRHHEKLFTTPSKAPAKNSRFWSRLNENKVSLKHRLTPQTVIY